MWVRRWCRVTSRARRPPWPPLLQMCGPWVSLPMKSSAVRTFRLYVNAVHALYSHKAPLCHSRVGSCDSNNTCQDIRVLHDCNAVSPASIVNVVAANQHFGHVSVAVTGTASLFSHSTIHMLLHQPCMTAHSSCVGTLCDTAGPVTWVPHAQASASSTRR